MTNLDGKDVREASYIKCLEWSSLKIKNHSVCLTLY